jgi:dTDP-4-amino-4,6-dideoxygalactose transaminase
MTLQPFIAFSRPEIDEAEINEVVDTLRSGWLTTGIRTAQFEKEFKDYVGANHALAVSSCTAALHLALAALEIGPGDEVITTPLTFCATVSVILHVGAQPVLADIGPDGNIEPASIEQRITPRTRAIIPVHYGGAPCDMNAIWKIAKKHDLAVIEDAAHAAGTSYLGRKIGSSEFSSDAVCFSFYATKNLTTGEGGMITANSKQLADRLKMLTLHGINKDAWNRYREDGSWYYEVVEAGFKYNLSDLQSAVGIHQLRKLDRFNARRKEYAELYQQEMGDLREVELPRGSEYGQHAWHLYSIRLNLEMLTIDRSRFISELRSRNIGTSVHFIPIQLHPFFKKWAHLPENDCPRCLSLYPRLISLPLYPSMTEAEVRYVARSVREIATKFRTRKVVASSWESVGEIRPVQGTAQSAAPAKSPIQRRMRG